MPGHRLRQQSLDVEDVQRSEYDRRHQPDRPGSYRGELIVGLLDIPRTNRGAAPPYLAVAALIVPMVREYAWANIIIRHDCALLSACARG